MSTHTVSRLLCAATLSCAIVLVSAAARGQATFDHFTCVKAKDSLPRNKFQVVLGPEFGSAPCTVKTPAKTACVATSNTSITPTPPGTPDGSPSGALLCYRAKCGRPAPRELDATDPFGHRGVTLRAPQTLCFPAASSSLATTTTVAFTGSTTTTTAQALGECTFNGSECRGTCARGSRCGAVVGTASCQCQPTPCGDASQPQCEGFCQDSSEACVFSVTGCSCARIP